MNNCIVNELGFLDSDGVSFEGFNECLCELVGGSGGEGRRYCFGEARGAGGWGGGDKGKGLFEGEIVEGEIVDCRGYVEELKGGIGGREMGVGDKRDFEGFAGGGSGGGGLDLTEMFVKNLGGWEASGVDQNSMILEVFLRGWASVSDLRVFKFYRDQGLSLHKGDMFGFNYLVYDSEQGTHSFLVVEFLETAKKASEVIQSSRISENYNKKLAIVSFTYKGQAKTHRDIDSDFRTKIQDLSQTSESNLTNFLVQFLGDIEIKQLIFSRIKSIKDIF
jgi:hypothetical protein